MIRALSENLLSVLDATHWYTLFTSTSICIGSFFHYAALRNSYAQSTVGHDLLEHPSTTHIGMDAAHEDNHAATEPQKHLHSRKSIACMPSPDTISETANKENMTADLSIMTRVKSKGTASTKKSRSKSIGPGGLDALKEDPGNRRKVSCLLLMAQT